VTVVAKPQGGILAREYRFIHRVDFFLQESPGNVAVACQEFE
ncbi:unnamed protein product, partial [Acidithrix sp. C25]